VSANEDLKEQRYNEDNGDLIGIQENLELSKRAQDNQIIYETNATGCINDCSFRGNCTNVTYASGANALVCNCDSDRAYNDCSYQRKSKLLAFIFSFLFGSFGADRFYLMYNEVGLFKLLLTCMLCIVPCLPICCMCCLQEERTNVIYSMVVMSVICVFIGMWIWWFVDWVLIVSDSLPDANGVSLKKDM